MTEGEGKNTWRPDRYSPCPRREAGDYLAFLASLGYQLSHIEQAVADGSTYAGDTPASEPLSGPADSEPSVPGEDSSEEPERSAVDGTSSDDRSVPDGDTTTVGVTQTAA